MTGVLHVVFKIAGSEYVLPASDIEQMESFDGATAVPGAPPFVVGIIQVRGRVVPVVDLRARFGLPQHERTLDSRVVVGKIEDRTVALLVDSAREVLLLRPEEMQPPPSMINGENSGFVKAVAHREKRLLMLIDFAKVVHEGELHVE